MNATLYEAIARIPLGTASAIEFCGPVLVSAARARTPRALLAAVIAGAGVVCVTGPTGIGTTNQVGLVFAAAAAIAYATKAVFTTRVAHSTHHRDDLALGLAASSLWRGESVEYDGPIGSFSGLRMADIYDGPPPALYSACLGA